MKNLKKLIIVRHGDYSQADGGNLTRTGRKQMELLGLHLKENHINGTIPRVLSSTLPRAHQSGQLVAQPFSVGVETSELLVSHDGTFLEPDKVLALINDPDEVVIMITHLEYAECLPLYFGKSFLNMDYGKVYFSKGTAYVINCETKGTATIHRLA